MTSQSLPIALNCHPLTPSVGVEAIRAKVELAAAGTLTLYFGLWGNLGRLRIPVTQPPGPVDELWRHTCFEAFVAVEGDTAYREFNFSPSGQWASYAFRNYRQRDDTTPSMPMLQVTPRCVDDGFELEACIPDDALPSGALLQIGLSAVVEDQHGTLSYWALRHPEARPDFHHRQGFALNLAQAGVTTERRL